MQQLKDIKEKILSVLKDAEILLIVPPFGSIHDVALGPHILQALAEEHGYKTDILYLNMLLASILGVEQYEKIYDAPLYWMLGERLFARSAYGLPPLGKHPEWCVDEAMAIRGKKKHVKMYYETNHHFDLKESLHTEQICTSFINEVIAVLASLNYNIIGCTTQTGQTNCCIALLTGIKKHSPETITIIGGSSCEGKMADGIASLSDAINYIFSGESETAFLNFLRDYSTQELPPQRIIPGEPLKNLDVLPLADYHIFSHQSGFFLEKNAPKIHNWYETSRGCWWARKSKCTFCGLIHISYRQKSINTVVHDIKSIRKAYSNNMLFITDIIMPHSYHKDLLPIMSNKEEFPTLAYQLRADHDLHDLMTLKNAKIQAILPGIESFSTNLLKLMHKGITGRQSLLFLRNARSVGIYADWYLLWGIPGDHISDYEDVLHVLPLIRHLQPPREFSAITFLRSSPYFEDPQDYNLSNLRPWAVYDMIYPDWAEIDTLAYWFIADYPCEAHEYPELIREIADEVDRWKKSWKTSKLVLIPFADYYIIYDSRNISGKSKKHILDASQAKEIMRYGAYKASEPQKWAVEHKLGVIIDSWYVPLVTAKPELLLEFEEGIQG